MQSKLKNDATFSILKHKICQKNISTQKMYIAGMCMISSGGGAHNVYPLNSM